LQGLTRLAVFAFQDILFLYNAPVEIFAKIYQCLVSLAGSGKQPLRLFNGQDIRDPGSLWRFDQGNCLPGFVDYPEVKTSGHKDRV